MSTQEENKPQDDNPWPEDTEVVLDIIRETGSKQWLNRYCQDPKTKVMHISESRLIPGRLLLL